MHPYCKLEHLFKYSLRFQKEGLAEKQSLNKFNTVKHPNILVAY